MCGEQGWEFLSGAVELQSRSRAASNDQIADMGGAGMGMIGADNYSIPDTRGCMKNMTRQFEIEVYPLNLSPLD